jgi:hypothetical protein
VVHTVTRMLQWVKKWISYHSQKNNIQCMEKCLRKICRYTTDMNYLPLYQGHLGWAFIALCTVAIFFTNPSLTDLTISIAFFFWEWNILWICICKYSHWRSMFAAFGTCSIGNNWLYQLDSSLLLLQEWQADLNFIVMGLYCKQCDTGPCIDTVVWHMDNKR